MDTSSATLMHDVFFAQHLLPRALGLATSSSWPLGLANSPWALELAGIVMSSVGVVVSGWAAIAHSVPATDDPTQHPVSALCSERLEGVAVREDAFLLILQALATNSRYSAGIPHPRLRICINFNLHHASSTCSVETPSSGCLPGELLTFGQMPQESALV